MILNVGDKVKVDLTKLHPILQSGCVFDGEIVRLDANKIVVKVPPVNGQSEFTVEPHRILSKIS